MCFKMITGLDAYYTARQAPALILYGLNQGSALNKHFRGAVRPSALSPKSTKLDRSTKYMITVKHVLSGHSEKKTKQMY